MCQCIKYQIYNVTYNQMVNNHRLYKSCCCVTSYMGQFSLAIFFLRTDMSTSNIQEVNKDTIALCRLWGCMKGPALFPARDRKRHTKSGWRLFCQLGQFFLFLFCICGLGSVLFSDFIFTLYLSSPNKYEICMIHEFPLESKIFFWFTFFMLIVIIIMRDRHIQNSGHYNFSKS